MLSHFTRNLISSTRLNCFSLTPAAKLTELVSNLPAYNFHVPKSRCFSLTSRQFVERRYHDKHEWVTVKDNIATVGISDYAQKALGSIVFIELPEVNSEFSKDDEVGCVESTKSANDIYSPISGKVVEVNERLESEPQLLNSSPYDEGWIYKMEIPNEDQFSRLMNEEQYEKFVKIQSGDTLQD